MSQTRKTAETREKDLRLAMFRIQQGRSHNGATHAVREMALSTPTRQSAMAASRMASADRLKASRRCEVGGALRPRRR